jgi:hypothetical protein
MTIILLAVLAVAAFVAVELLRDERQEAALEAMNHGDTVVIPYKALHKGKTSAWLKEIVRKRRKQNKRYKGRHKRPWLFSHRVSVAR